MTPPPELARNIAGRWLRYADEDLRTARHILSMPRCSYRNAAFFAQQCAEKALKGPLVSQYRDYPYTHNISLLLERCEDIATWAAQAEAAETLTPYAESVRYPGRDEPVTESEAHAATDAAEHVLRNAETTIAT